MGTTSAAMIHEVHAREEPRVEFVPSLRAGTGAAGEFHCSACGYGVTIFRQLPPCPMCGGEVWERSAWSRVRGSQLPA